MPKITKIDRMPVHSKSAAALFRKRANVKTYAKDNGVNISANYKINSASQMALNIIDKLSPVINTHPKICKVVVLSFEKFIKLSENFSK